MNDKARPIVGIILTAMCVLLVVGILTFAGPCAASGDASAETCHGASRAALGAGVVALILSIVRIFERDEGERRGLDLGIALVGVLVAALPGVLIGLCAAQTARCHSIMQPFCLGVGIVLALVAAGDLVKRLLSLRKR